MSKSKLVRGSTACIAGITDRHRCGHSRSTSALASPPGIVRHSITHAARSGIMLGAVPPSIVPVSGVVGGGSKPSANGPLRAKRRCSAAM
jgi:hypothetical protein